MSAYIVTGPVDVGTTALQTNINGNISLPDTATIYGDVLFINGDATPHVQALAPGPNGFVLTTHGIGAAPTWSGVSSSTSGFSARKVGTQGPIGNVPTVISGWSTAALPEYDTIGTFNPVTGIFVTPSNGTYIISAKISFLISNNSGTRIISIRIAGIEQFSTQWQPNANINIQQNAELITQLSLTAGQTVSVVAYTTNGTMTIQPSINTWFCMAKLS